MDHAIEAVRRFNRFYVQHVGALDAHFAGSDISLTEARLIFEIACLEHIQGTPVTAAALQHSLQIDRGQLSRMIGRLTRRNLIHRDCPEHDRRLRPITLTPGGREMLSGLEKRVQGAIRTTLAALDPLSRDDLVTSLTHARFLLAPSADASLTLRAPRPGEVSLIASRQSALYAQSHGWGHKLECLIAETASRFLSGFDPAREACWVADLDQVMAGAVFLTDEGDGVARLRLLHVEPFARRRGIGDALVQQCLAFAREKHYRRVILWTHTVLENARRLYARNGFSCVATAPHDLFGVPLQGEDWICELITPDAQTNQKP
ncbi:bifunctional helix-turn-helix transcriptional regulator/GNAT family N-acetyltransferase [Asaia sp. As-1742]|uniref:bifunctional helix-turn-helix transcriptional regulator/GNAT family N-acetyltransferase n=1 Tax=Asaia sp. As-1742 TaxID=2608325 RepID=UPI0014201604|nr:bifunctional helix-turn-helix transcriptional regulator/GNAT family N-acetyltransferase [Asaia sp. As-1742]NIE80890.1 GNAT family N-acetyltransferase [Asaia sp. As-1742]